MQKSVFVLCHLCSLAFSSSTLFLKMFDATSLLCRGQSPVTSVSGESCWHVHVRRLSSARYIMGKVVVMWIQIQWRHVFFVSICLGWRWNFDFSFLLDCNRKWYNKKILSDQRNQNPPQSLVYQLIRWMLSIF